jgi:hypothetical protein
MGAPLENQFWKLRSKHGRDRLFASPDDLWEAACEYFNWCDAHPWWRNEAIKSGDDAGKLIKIPIGRPYTMQGLCLYLDCNTVYFNKFEKSLEGREDELSKGFCQIILRVRQAIYQQKFEGAAVGAFNSNLIARELGIADKQESRHVDKDGNDIAANAPAQIIIMQVKADDDELEIKESEE